MEKVENYLKLNDKYLKEGDALLQRDDESGVITLSKHSIVLFSWMPGKTGKMFCGVRA